MYLVGFFSKFIYVYMSNFCLKTATKSTYSNFKRINLPLAYCRFD